MALLFHSPSDDPQRWQKALARHLPDLDFRVWPDGLGEAADIEFALVWKPPPGMLAGLPNLKAVLSLGAGVEHITDPPPGIPVVRLVDPVLTRGMTEYVSARVLHYFREFPHYAASQRRGEWQKRPFRQASEFRVGVMGLGILGGDAAAALTALGFSVAGWSATEKHLEGIESFHGADRLSPFLQRTDILVCLLPLTAETEGIINARTLAALPRGAYLINAARGGHVDEDALLAALESGRLAGATLDVFKTEPLPAGHPFWGAANLTLTPHIASLTVPASAGAEIAANIARIQGGQAPLHAVDPVRGY
jgi:glyoxylate/hydroxypyruvate reductase A